MATAKQVQSGATTVDFLRIIACSFSFFGFPERAFLFSSRECLWVINVEDHDACTLLDGKHIYKGGLSAGCTVPARGILGGSAEFTEMPGTGIENVLNLP